MDAVQALDEDGERGERHHSLRGRLSPSYKHGIIVMRDTRDDGSQRLEHFLGDLALLGSLQGFRYFQPWLRGREEILITVVNEDLSCPSLRSPVSLSSDSNGRTPVYNHEQNAHRDSSLLPPASPCDREIAIPETHCTLFLLAAYAKYGRPYVWVRSNHQRLIGGDQDDSRLRDTPLALPSSSEWKRRDVAVWHVVWDVVNACISPPPRNALSVDFAYLRSLPLSERSLSSGALIGFFHRLLLREPRGTPLYTYVWEELGELTRLHAQTLQDLTDNNLIRNPL
ncbi:uncharacterized protein LOC128491592 [Spea bombifrons]|uniref:uncharacterized protein LOC128491592 n=1 Tax=Spea bombifrons TaxID=233779 RepID=UPI00234B68BD|nr:uncharacterized protein LOC128491592 [Spea bombifrons]